MRGLFGCLSFTLAVVITVPLPAEIPLQFSIVDADGRPAWVPADQAIVDGMLLPGPFHPYQYEALQDMIEAAREHHDRAAKQPCDVVTMTMDSAPGETTPPDSPSEFARSATTILDGTVRDSVPGFFHGTPGTLYELAVNEVLKGNPSEIDGAEVYFFYRTAEIQVGDVFLCYHAARGMERPDLGRSVILLLDRPLDRADVILVPLDHQILFEKEDGGVSAPKRYPTTPASLAAFERSLKESLGRTR